MLCYLHFLHNRNLAIKSTDHRVVSFFTFILKIKTSRLAKFMRHILSCVLYIRMIKKKQIIMSNYVFKIDISLKRACYCDEYL